MPADDGIELPGEQPGDELTHTGTPRLGGYDIRDRFDCRQGIVDRHRESAHAQERLIVFGIADANGSV